MVLVHPSHDAPVHTAARLGRPTWPPCAQRGQRHGHWPAPDSHRPPTSRRARSPPSVCASPHTSSPAWHSRFSHTFYPASVAFCGHGSRYCLAPFVLLPCTPDWGKIAWKHPLALVGCSYLQNRPWTLLFPASSTLFHQVVGLDQNYANGIIYQFCLILTNLQAEISQKQFPP